MSWKRGLRAPLLFLGLAAATWSSTVASPAGWFAAVALISASAFCAPASASSESSVLAVVAAFSVWVVGTNFFANPSYTAAGLFHPALLAAGVFAARGGAISDRALPAAALAFAVCLSGWALFNLDWIPAEGRARAPFETPAILSAALTMVLIPGLVHLLAGARALWMSAAIVLIAGAVTAAQSRGGWLGLAAGVIVAGLVAHRGGVRILPGMAAAAALVICASAALQTVQPSAAPARAQSAAPLGQSAASAAQSHSLTESASDRLQLYWMTASAIASASPVLGSGYLSFRYHLEERRADVPGFAASATEFAHNDYLQTLLELGVPGLVLLALLIGWPLGRAWTRAKGADRATVVANAGAAGAIASMAVHALVDFPFYVPLCLLLFGLAIGCLDAAGAPPAAPAVIGAPVRAIRAALVTIAAALLAKPVAAEVAASYAHREWAAARTESAAYWFEVARRLEMRDWRYHWYVGQFWYAQARQGGGVAAARRAEASFADGLGANPREARNRAGLLATQRDFARLLGR